MQVIQRAINYTIRLLERDSIAIYPICKRINDIFTRDGRNMYYMMHNIRNKIKQGIIES